ncbi:hypothetical protein [Salinicoccus sp. HZC-1]|uniref:hypothetical protein n=1 Tax=Salinicoccus sp. HZC-1 TaxID=3385497 RepID=UPI00398B223F
MRTFLAFKLNDNIHEKQQLNNITNLKDYYEETYLNYTLSSDYQFHKNLGAFILDDEASILDFPSTIERETINILTFFPPLNYKDFSVNKETAMLSISQALLKDKLILNDLTAPLLFSIIDKENDELNIYMDILGITRLYVLENEKGIFWSNRPSALHIFSGHKAKMDLNSWKSYAVAGWFMDEDSPFQNVYRVPLSTVISVKADNKGNQKYQMESTGGIKNLINTSINQIENPKVLVTSILENLNNYIDLWNADIKVDISGGKDSRVSAASVLNSKAVNYSFRTINDIDEELNISRELLSKVQNNSRIELLDPELYIKEQPDLIERVDRLLFEYDGDFSTVMISSPIIETNDFNTLDSIKINGFGGEVGKGAYYSNERWIKKLELMGEDAAYYRLATHFVKIGCVPLESINIMKKKLESILEEGRKLNIKGLKLLDYFHFMERFRRWTPLSGQIHCYSPFINNRFIASALTNEPTENMKANMHNQIITALVPEWEGIKFFKATPEQSKEKDHKKLRLWQTKDKKDIEKILRNPILWNDVFLEEEVLDLWEKAIREGIPNFKETLFHRVAMRAKFNSHLERINKAIDSNYSKL